MAEPPSWLSPSVAVDVMLLLAGVKPAIRVESHGRRLELRRWARRHGLFASFDQEGFVALSRSASHSRRVIDVDGRPGRHTLLLGTLLGYPACCGRAAARVGDEGIDELAERIAGRRFIGRFRRIDPVAYRVGSAAISHVPCSSRCEASLALAGGTRRC